VVKVTPTSVGALQLRVKAAAVQDFAGNSMSADGTDDTTVTVAQNEPCSYGLVGWTKSDCRRHQHLHVHATGFLAMWGAAAGMSANTSLSPAVAAAVTTRGGGGGAGGLLYGTTNVHLPATNYTVTVGAGGAGSAGSGTRGSNGRNTSVSNATARGISDCHWRWRWRRA